MSSGQSTGLESRQENRSIFDLLARSWRRLPVVVRAILLGCLVLFVGGLATGPFIFANTKLWPAFPWSVPFLTVYMWLFWQYLRGRWWPRSTSGARREGLRANALSPRVWRWALTSGYLAMASNYALHWVFGRLTPLNFAVPDLLRPLPPVTLLFILLMVSATAGLVEEAAFRGFMCGPIEKRHGVVIAIIVVSTIFGLAHLTDWQPSMTAARMFFILLASVLYGVLVRLTNSILPGVVLHATGNAIGIVWIWSLSRGSRPETSRLGFAAASGDPQFWLNSALALAFGVAAVWAFLRLADVTRTEKQEQIEGLA